VGVQIVLNGCTLHHQVFELSSLMTGFFLYIWIFLGFLVLLTLRGCSARVEWLYLSGKLCVFPGRCLAVTYFVARSHGYTSWIVVVVLPLFPRLYFFDINHAFFSPTCALSTHMICTFLYLGTLLILTNLYRADRFWKC
jgi:hypothetical protein